MFSLLRLIFCVSEPRTENIFEDKVDEGTDSSATLVTQTQSELMSKDTSASTSNLTGQHIHPALDPVHSTDTETAHEGITGVIANYLKF